jgi:hypothetical protein
MKGCPSLQILSSDKILDPDHYYNLNKLVSEKNTICLIRPRKKIVTSERAQ